MSLLQTTKDWIVGLLLGALTLDEPYLTDEHLAWDKDEPV